MPDLHGVASNGRPWTPKEKEIVKARYLRDGARKLAEELGRSFLSVAAFGRRNKLNRKRRWTTNDDRLLQAIWGEMSVGNVARQLNRTKATVYWRARKLGLPCGASQGLEYLSHAADRTGFDTKTLRKILRWAGVPIKRTMSRPTGSRRGYHCADPLDVDDAVARWLATETVQSAASRRGVDGEALARWLMDAGVIKRGEKRRRNDHWRINSEVIDRVVKHRQQLRTISSEAARIGVTRLTLARWLKEAGERGSDGKLRLVHPAAVDRVVAERVSRKTCRWRGRGAKRA